MVPPSSSRSRLTPEVCVRAIEARDPRFDGVFFVGITSTRIYCRPICPARVSRPDNRRFFQCAAAAENAGFRPCRRCRPELAPGKSLVDAVSRLAFAAERRIAEGALNGRPVGALARELCVGERHLRRALQRELGVSPIQLAQTHRLLLAKRLLTDTQLPMTQVAFASGFQSLRRFNALFRDGYGMSPSTLRRRPRSKRAGRAAASAPDRPAGRGDPFIEISLSYRKPFNWNALVHALRSDALPEVEQVSETRYARTVSIEGHVGILVVRDDASRGRKRRAEGCLDVEISPSLLPALMPLIARLRNVFDLDAEPAVIEGVLAEAGLGSLVRRFPGIRLPGAFDGFEHGLALLLRSSASDGGRPRGLVRQVVTRLGEPIETGFPGLAYLSPRPERVAAGEPALVESGVPPDRARAITGLARAVLDDSLHLRPGGDPAGTFTRLVAIPGLDERLAKRLIGRTLGWPDTFDPSDPELQGATGTSSVSALEARADRWRPWRAYGALLHRTRDASRDPHPPRRN